jgi:mannan endo-1,4-beta-mannosidase
VDIVSYDNYRDLSDRYYYELLDLAEGKPIALGEVGRPPSAETLKAQPRWAWFMVWAGMVDRQADALKTTYSDPYLIGRGDPLPKN